MGWSGGSGESGLVGGEPVCEELGALGRVAALARRDEVVDGVGTAACKGDDVVGVLILAVGAVRAAGETPFSPGGKEFICREGFNGRLLSPRATSAATLQCPLWVLLVPATHALSGALRVSLAPLPSKLGVPSRISLPPGAVASLVPLLVSEVVLPLARSAGNLPTVFTASADGEVV